MFEVRRRFSVELRGDNGKYICQVKDCRDLSIFLFFFSFERFLRYGKFLNISREYFYISDLNGFISLVKYSSRPRYNQYFDQSGNIRSIFYRFIRKKEVIEGRF